MIRHALTAWGAPMARLEEPDPEPRGTEVIVRVRCAGVCHSDLHIAEGHFDLGEDGVLSMESRGLTLPKTLGHEIAGEVAARGPQAGPVPDGPVLVHPWIGCGACPACARGEENACAQMRALGIQADGGYATHVRVPDARWLVSAAGLDLALATPLTCSGVTVYNALRRAGAVPEGHWLAVLGCGGLGLNAVAIAGAMGHRRIVAVDVDPAKLAAAEALGAAATVDAREGGPGKLRAATGGALAAAVDTVGSPATARLGIDALVKTGRYVVVGLYGGTLRLPIPLLPMKMLTVQGSYTGSRRDLAELVDLVRSGRVPQMPVETRPLDRVNETLDDLRAGRITGRVVLAA